MTRFQALVVLLAIALASSEDSCGIKDRNRNVIDHYFTQLSTGNASAVAQLFAEDAVGTYPPFLSMGIKGGTVNGRGDLEQFYIKLISAFSDLRAYAMEVVMDPSGLSAASPLRAEGILASGGAAAMDNINLWNFNSMGQITNLRVYSGGGVPNEINGQSPPTKLSVSLPDASGKVINATVCHSSLIVRAPILIFAHGWLVAAQDYDYMCRQLAVGVGGQPWVVAFIDTPLEDPKVQPPLLLPLADAAAFLAMELPKLPALAGRLDGKVFLGGHSLGGGTSVLAASTMGTEVAALALFAPGLSGNPNADATKVNSNTPALVILGSNDCVNDPSEPLRGIDTYQKLASKKKALVVLKDGNHCFFSTLVRGSCPYDICTSLPRLDQQAAALRIFQRFSKATEGDVEWTAFEDFLATGGGMGVEWSSSATSTGNSTVANVPYPLCPGQCCSDGLAKMGLCKQSITV